MTPTARVDPPPTPGASAEASAEGDNTRPPSSATEPVPIPAPAAASGSSGAFPPAAAAPPPPPPPPPAGAAAAVGGAPGAAVASGQEAEAPQLTVLSGLPSAVFPMRQGELVIGRSAEADLQLKHPEISRRHCRLTWDGQNGTIEDLASRWGTKVNGAALSAGTRAPLQPGDRLQIGPVLVHYGFGPPPLAAQAAAAGGADGVAADGSILPGAGSELPAEVAGPAAVAVGSTLRGARVLFRGAPVERLPLLSLTSGRLSFGRSEENEVVLADPSISRKHATVERVADGFLVTDLHSRAGSLANGRRFEQHRLVIGDQLQMGPFFFRFDGQALERTSGLSGIEIEAQHVSKHAGGHGGPLGRLLAGFGLGGSGGARTESSPAGGSGSGGGGGGGGSGSGAGVITILDDVSVKIERGQFVAILGPSGSGKSSLLDTLTGLRPGQAGRILFDKADFYVHYNQLHSLLGYVPQDDIVHTELSVTQALLFSARLRLPAGTPAQEIAKLVAQTIERLGLAARAQTPIARLSGGQRKRVSVGVELLARPAVLFLDEPTSGLDPAAEFKMMELLRHLADGGCTVICTTHVMENVYLTDRIFVISGGNLVFGGNVQEAREHFGVPKLNMLYDRLEEFPTAYWKGRFLESGSASAVPPPPLGDATSTGANVGGPALLTTTATRKPRFKSQPRKSNLGTLLARQWAILSSDWKNFLILFGQPLIIAMLVAWVTDEAELELFFAYLATLWFGCSNAAQEIVRELPIYRRERMVGLGRHPYLLSKFGLMGTLTAVQGLFLYGCLHAGGVIFRHAADKGLEGSLLWQIGALVGTAFASVGIGLAISALSRTTMQAVMVVPLILIPQILLSGRVVDVRTMKDRPGVIYLARLVPSFASQRMMDLSYFWNQPLTQPRPTATNPRATRNLPTERNKAFTNLKESDPRYTRLQALDERERENPALADDAAFQAERSALSDVISASYGFKATYNQLAPGLWAVGGLVAWTLLGYLIAYFGLRAKERG